MPIYEYKCQDCGHVLEALRRMGQGPEGLACPKCGSERLGQLLSTFAARTGSSAAPSAPCGAPASACGSGGG